MTTSAELRAKCLADTRAQAVQAFAQHEIAEETDGRWVIRRRHADGRFESTYWTEICVMAGGYLYVNGDIDLVVFGYGSGKGLARVAWMATAGESYAAEKASIGMSAGRAVEPVYDWEHDIAVQRIREALTPDEDGDTELSLSGLVFDDADEALDDLERQDDGQEAFCAWLHEHWGGEDLDGLWDAGRVLSSRVIYAQAACARLVELVEARESAQAKESA